MNCAIAATSDQRLMVAPTAITTSRVTVDFSDFQWSNVAVVPEAYYVLARMRLRYLYWFHHKGKRPKRGNPCRHH
jgi:hypothetical protein